MAETGVARVFMNGRSQAVRLPKEFRLSTNQVRVRRGEAGELILEPLPFDHKAWLAQLKKMADPNFMAEGRNQPPTPPGKDLFD